MSENSMHLADFRNARGGRRVESLLLPARLIFAINHGQAKMLK
jgi:hypothetical protein